MNPYESPQEIIRAELVERPKKRRPILAIAFLVALSPFMIGVALSGIWAVTSSEGPAAMLCWLLSSSPVFLVAWLCIRDIQRAMRYR